MWKDKWQFQKLERKIQRLKKKGNWTLYSDIKLRKRVLEKLSQKYEVKVGKLYRWKIYFGAIA